MFKCCPNYCTKCWFHHEPADGCPKVRARCRSELSWNRARITHLENLLKQERELNKEPTVPRPASCL